MNEIEVKNKFKDYFLTCLYKNGFRYIVKHREGLIEAFKNMPEYGRSGWISDDGFAERAFFSMFDDLFEDWPEGELKDIFNEAGIVDWSKVSINARVFVKDNVDDEWVPQHFSGYKNGVIYCFNAGRSYFTTNGEEVSWKYGKLADE